MEKLTGLMVVALIIGLAVDSAESKTIHVKVGGTGDGSSWATAFGDLQSALDDADPNDEIWVAEGTYIPTELSDPCDSRSATFSMKNGVGIYGGFPAVGDPNRDDRDHEVYVTVLSGDLLGNDDPGTAVADLLNDPCRGDNSYHVVTGTGESSVPNTILDGFTVTAGNANDYWPDSDGGGLYRYPGLINKCTITGNSAGDRGGGVQCASGDAIVTDCTFAGNSAHEGGAMSQEAYGQMRVSGCIFTNNLADYGGGVFVLYALSLTDCTFTGNLAVEEGGGIFSDEGGLAINNCTFSSNSAEFGGGIHSTRCYSLTLTNCTFSNNSARWWGGGMYDKYAESATLTNCTFTGNSAGEYGGGMYKHGSRMTVIGCTFNGNSAWWGGGMYNDYFIGSVTNCTFSGNSTIEEGAGMYNLRGNPIVTGCTFSGNWSYAGGGMDNDECTVKVADCTFTGNSAVYGGGGMDNFDSSVTISQCTFCDNRAYDGDGTSLRNEACSPVVANCILWGNTAEDYPQIYGTASVTFSNVQGGWEGMGNIDIDPCCTDPGHWEDPCGTPDYYRDDIFIPGDYHLKSQAGRYDPETEMWVYDDVTSPCIDAGDPMNPIGREPFPNGGIINMGAYGGTTEASKSYFGKPPCEIIVAGDVNGDCEVNFPDFCLMALHWCKENNP
ncbi:MAG: hypothetical protein JXN61_12785 [Sedimentisphaerales bacterium]|nr:hypothetical protein [Sedimentisphaerales bacterium]